MGMEDSCVGVQHRVRECRRVLHDRVETLRRKERREIGGEREREEGRRRRRRKDRNRGERGGEGGYIRNLILISPQFNYSADKSCTCTA